MSEQISTDLCVIGAGSGGLSLAAGAVQMGARVVLVEGGKMGGECLNTGCVPSKALLAAASHAHAMTTGGPFGVTPVAPEIDFAKVMEHVRSVIAAIAPHDSEERFTSLGVRVIRAFGTFQSSKLLQAGDAAITARRFVIATGSRPAIPPIAGLGDVPFLTSETLFDLAEKPQHLLVIGAGATGLEMAQAFVRLGSRVTVLDARQALGGEDPEAVAVVLARLRAEGVDIRENQTITGISGQTGSIRAALANGQTATGTHLLVAAGRLPNVERLNLAAAGVAANKNGIQVNAGLRSSNRRIYAAGDVAGGPQFTHVAGYHAGIVIRSAMFAMPATARADLLPRAVFTDPELAQAGLTEAEAREKTGKKLEVVRFGFSGNDRAVAERKTEGFVKAMVSDRRVIGATIVGPQAGELIQIWALALAEGMNIGDIAGMVAPYPTLGETSKRAAGQFYVPRLFASAGVKRFVRFVQRF